MPFVTSGTFGKFAVPGSACVASAVASGVGVFWATSCVGAGAIAMSTLLPPFGCLVAVWYALDSAWIVAPAGTPFTVYDPSAPVVALISVGPSAFITTMRAP